MTGVNLDRYFRLSPFITFLQQFERLETFLSQGQGWANYLWEIILVGITTEIIIIIAYIGFSGLQGSSTHTPSGNPGSNDRNACVVLVKVIWGFTLGELGYQKQL